MGELVPYRDGEINVCAVFWSYQLLSRAKSSRLNEQLACRLEGEKVDEVQGFVI